MNLLRINKQDINVTKCKCTNRNTLMVGLVWDTKRNEMGNHEQNKIVQNGGRREEWKETSANFI